MPSPNPYQPPAAPVADINLTEPADIDALNVSASWKARFEFIQKAGGPKLNIDYHKKTMLNDNGWW